MLSSVFEKTPGFCSSMKLAELSKPLIPSIADENPNHKAGPIPPPAAANDCAVGAGQRRSDGSGWTPAEPFRKHAVLTPGDVGSSQAYRLRHNGEKMKTKAWLAPLLLFMIEPGCMHRPPQFPSVPAAPIPLTLPAGSMLAVITAQAIDSSSARPGQTFAAVVSRDANDIGGQTILPSGSPATLILLRASDATDGTFELRLASVTLNGNSYLVRNDSEADNPAVYGATLGTFLGGVTGTQNALSPGPSSEAPLSITITGDRIFVPVGSLLTFRLSGPVRLVGSH